MIKDIFKDFIAIGYTPKKRSHFLHDTLSCPYYILIRQTELNCKIIYLYSGTSITISSNWIDIFTQFYNHSGSKVEFEQHEYDLDSVDKFIYYFTKFQVFLSKDLSEISVEDFLETILKFSEIGTEKFISWEKEEDLGLDLEQFEFSSLDKDCAI